MHVFVFDRLQMRMRYSENNFTDKPVQIRKYITVEIIMSSIFKFHIFILLNRGDALSIGVTATFSLFGYYDHLSPPINWFSQFGCVILVWVKNSPGHSL